MLGEPYKVGGKLSPSIGTRAGGNVGEPYKVTATRTPVCVVTPHQHGCIAVTVGLWTHNHQCIDESAVLPHSIKMQESDVMV